VQIAMSAQTQSRFGVRGAVSGFIVYEPASPFRDAVKRLRNDCEKRVEALKQQVLFQQGATAQSFALPLKPIVDPDISPAMTHDADRVASRLAVRIPNRIRPMLAIVSPLTARGGAFARGAFGFVRARMPQAETREAIVAKARLGLILLSILAAAAYARSKPAIGFLWRILRSVPLPGLAKPLPQLRPLAPYVAAFGLALALLTAFTPRLPPSVDVPSPVAPPPPAPPVWRDVVRPLAVFNLEGGMLSGHALTYAARVRTDGAREDMMSWAQPGQLEAAPVAVVVVHRRPTVEATEQRLFSEVARRAAVFGQSLTAGSVPNAIATKFGDLEVMDVRLSGPQGEQSCLAFRHVAWSAPLAITGWRCGTKERPIDRPSLVCFIDRLDVLSVGQEFWLRDYFAESEHFRSFCATKRVRAGVKPTSTVEPGAAAPILKRDITGSIRKKRSAKTRRN
jgi:hypothetical protein